MADDPKERAALIEEMQARLEEAMEAAALAASAAHQAGPSHTRGLQFQPDFTSSVDLMSRMQAKKLAEEKYYDDEDDYGAPAGYAHRTRSDRRRGDAYGNDDHGALMRQASDAHMSTAAGPQQQAKSGGNRRQTKKKMVRKGTVRKLVGGGTSAQANHAKEMMERMREQAKHQQAAGGGSMDIGGPLIRSATQDLEEAKERRERIGKYAPDEEARQRARAKFRRALSKIKVKGLTNKMLQASRKKKGHGKSLKRINSETWEHGGEAGRERRRKARRKSMAKRAAKRKSRAKSRRGTIQAGEQDGDIAAASRAAEEAMNGNADLSNMIDTVIEEGDEAEHAD